MRALLLSLFLVCVATATPPKVVPLAVEGNTVMVVKSFPVMVKAPTGKGLFLWMYSDAVKAATDPDADNVLIVKSAPKGTHTIRVLNVRYNKTKDDFEKENGSVEIVVGEVPGPGPGPEPGPTPDPGPVPVGDLRVLEVHEEEELAKLPLEQLRVIRGPKFRDLLKSKCGPDKSTADGKAYWMIDKDSDVSKLPKFWQDAFKRPRTALPFIHIYKGDTPVFEGPLPTTEAGAIALVTKYAEGK